MVVFLLVCPVSLSIEGHFIVMIINPISGASFIAMPWLRERLSKAICNLNVNVQLSDVASLILKRYL